MAWWHWMWLWQGLLVIMMMFAVSDVASVRAAGAASCRLCARVGMRAEAERPRRLRVSMQVQAEMQRRNASFGTCLRDLDALRVHVRTACVWIRVSRGVAEHYIWFSVHVHAGRHQMDTLHGNPQSAWRVVRPPQARRGPVLHGQGVGSASGLVGKARCLILSLRGGRGLPTHGSGDPMDDRADHVVGINASEYDPGRRYAEFSNMTLDEYEEAVHARSAAVIESTWSDVDTEDAMQDTDEDAGAGDAGRAGSLLDQFTLDSVNVSNLPAWQREAMEKQALPVESTRVTSFLEKYHEVLTGEVNQTNLEEGLQYWEEKLESAQSPVKLLLEEMERNFSTAAAAAAASSSSSSSSFSAADAGGASSALQGVGMSVSCLAPLRVCVVTRVVPLLSAWDEAINPGDILVKDPRPFTKNPQP